MSDITANILNYSLPELESLVLSMGEKKFRAKQIFGWLADEMSNVPAGLRRDLAENGYYIGQPEVVTMQESKTDGTRKCLYEFTSIDEHHNPFQEWIHHSNGHRYYPFHISLYGISYLDIDTLEVFHYIPRGYDNDYGAPNGESFIITDIHYDPQSDLIAYGGCYWAGTSDVMVGVFRDPMQFDPHLCSVHEILDPEYEELDDVDFDKWDDGLLVKADGKSAEKISVQTRLNAMKTQAEQKERKS